MFLPKRSNVPTFQRSSDLPEQWRAALTTALFLVAVSLLTTATAAQPSPSNPHSALRTPHSALPIGAWQVISSPTASNLRDVYMTSANNGWAVGENGTTLHYNGAAWQIVNISSTNTLVDVYMVNANNGYILSWTDSGSEIFKWDGSAWTSNYTSTYSLNSIDGSGANNVWAAGLNATLHWDGAQWTFVPIPVERQLFNMRVVGSNDMWAFGQYEPVNGDGLILHNTGSGWVQITSPAPQTLFDASFTGSNDGWAVGTAVTTTYVLHWDGVGWTWAYTNSLGIFDIFMLSPTDGWATGQSQDGPTISHFENGAFVQVTNPSERVFLNSIYMLSPNEGWIVGDEGAILRYRDESATPTPIATSTITPTTIATVTSTIGSRTVTPTPTRTPTATRTVTTTPCVIAFTDVQPADYFYEAVRYLYCGGAISGYQDGTFRPYNNTTRGQLCKIVVLAEGWPLNCPPNPSFTDVPVSDPFYCYIETIARRGGIISGYSDGTFRPYNNVTRAQLSKIIVLAEEWPINTSGGPHFTDVTTTDPFYDFIETAYNLQIISGYADGTFRPGNNATRGQICKIVYQAITAP